MFSTRVAGISLALCVALSGCLQGTGANTSSPDAPRATDAVERDVEAPNVFSERDTGLWDGRPSLGGVWVAHPEVTAPERVIIRNTDSGRETVGALFKRERMNPGPVFQVSAEAAEAVGMLAGAPTALEVVALRTEEIRPDPGTATDTAAAQAPDTDTEVAAASDAAPQDPPSPQNAAAASDAADEATIATPEAEEPRKRGFFARLFGRDEPAETPITATPLDAEAPAADAPPPMPTPVGGDSPDAANPNPLDRPLVQIGIFSIESNAKGAAKTMRDADLTARIKPGRAQGNAFWRVVVGPASSRAERRQILEQVKTFGFADAYAVRR